MNSTQKMISQNRSGFNAAKAAAWLERKGWKREIAGDADFEKAVKAMVEIESQPKKSLLLMGAVGVGKSSLAQIVFDAVQGDKTKIDCANTAEVDFLVPEADAARNNGVYSSGAHELLGRSVWLDDIGAEGVLKNFGNDLDRVGNFIVRYHTTGKRRLILTTNLDGKMITAKYGARVFDRLLDMCVIVKFEGKSKRDRAIID